MTSHLSSPRVRLLAPAAVLGVLLLTGCSGVGPNDTASTAGRDAPAAQPQAPEAAAGDALGSAFGSDAGAKARTVAETRAVIATGTVRLRGDDVQQARDAVAALVAKHGGQIDDEKSTSDDKGVLDTARLVLRVPSADFTEVLDKLKGVAELESVSSKAEDVTTQVIDTGVRVRAQERSISRIETLLDRAQSIRDIVSIESELTRRQANLDSLKAQQAYLADQTTLATISVEIVRTDAPVVKEPDHRGFLAGLAAGWDGLRATTVGVLTVAGAVLPFAVVLAVLGWPVWFLVRLLMRRPVAPVGGAAEPPSQA